MWRAAQRKLNHELEISPQQVGVYIIGVNKSDETHSLIKDHTKRDGCEQLVKKLRHGLGISPQQIGVNNSNETH